MATFPIRRRTFLGGLLAGLAVRGAGAETPSATLSVGAVAEPGTLDPQAAAAVNDLRIVANIFEGLVRFRPGSTDIEPALATAWQASEDGLAWRFALREGVRFHDGTPFDAAAVAYTFARVTDPAHPDRNGAVFPLAFNFAAVRDVVASDPMTAEFRLSEPYAPLLAALASPAGSIVSPTAVAAGGAASGRRPIGTGPFRFEAWDPNVEVRLAANSAFRDGAPKPAQLVFRPLADPHSRAAALARAEVDVAMDLPFPMLAALKAAGATVAVSDTPHLWFVILNARDGPFSDRRVRQAANLAVNKARIADEILGGAATVAGDPVPTAFDWADDPALKPYPYDPERARTLVRQAGAEGASLSLLVPDDGAAGMLQPLAMADAIRGDLEAVGFQVTVSTRPWGEFLGVVNPGLPPRLDMAAMAWTTDDPDTLPFLALRGSATAANGGLNAGHYANPDVDRLVEEARRTSDRARRAALYRELQRVVQEDAPWLFVASARANVAGRAGVSNLSIQPNGIVRFRDVGVP